MKRLVLAAEIFSPPLLIGIAATLYMMAPLHDKKEPSVLNEQSVDAKKPVRKNIRSANPITILKTMKKNMPAIKRR